MTTAPVDARPVRTDVLLTLAVIAAVASIILTVAAFWLSYAHLHEVAEGNGLGGSPERAWAWPATLDLFIVIGEVLWLRASLQRRTDGWAISLTVVGSGGSIALNIAGVGAGASALNYVVAAVPPSAALIAFGALMRQLHGALAARLAVAPVSAPAERPAVPETESQDERPLERPVTPEPERDPEPEPERPPKPKRERRERAHRPRTKSAARPVGERRRERARQLYDDLGKRPEWTEIRDALAADKLAPKTISRPTCQRIRDAIEKDEPKLAALGSDNVRALTGS